MQGLLWSWSYGSWIYYYLCNQCLSPLTLWVRTPLKRDVLDTTLCDKVCRWLAAGRWFSPDTPVSSSNKTDCHDITVILLLKVALSTITKSNYHKITTTMVARCNWLWLIKDLIIMHTYRDIYKLLLSAVQDF
jgi:hypothetical protein